MDKHVVSQTHFLVKRYCIAIFSETDGRPSESPEEKRHLQENDATAKFKI